jgi:5-methylcytosine-specific restriction endonuclease McrA
MDYASIIRNQEKKYNPFGFSSPSNISEINVRFQAAQALMAIEKEKKETVKETVKEIVKDTQKETIIKLDTPTKKKVKKEKIPATLKNIVWHKYFETSLTGLCQCCKVENISKAIFDAGHIISEKNGGQVILENLKPICKLCNSSMGKTNMDEFMKKYGI